MEKIYRKNILETLKKEKSSIVINLRKKFKVLLVYPNSYYLGMSNLGFQSIYHILNNLPQVSCERAFIPVDNKKPLSYETQTFPEYFNLIIFSVSFELDYLNIIKFLMLSQIPILSKNRKNYPIIAAGGIAITLNYAPLLEIVDYFLIGEGEDLIHKFLEALINNQVPDTESVASKQNQAKKRNIYKGDYVCRTVVFTPDTEFSDTMLVEIARGCPYKCKFCAASYNYTPYRINKTEKILDMLDLYESYYKKVGIVGASVTNHPGFIDICKWLNNRNIKFSITSLRLDTVTLEILEELIKGGIKTFTVAIESGSEELRNKIGKNLSNEAIFSAIEKFIYLKIIDLKFYFMVGLPEETFEDVESIIELIKKIKNMYIKKTQFLKKLGKFTISVNPFIPKPNTPFYKFSMEHENILLKKIKLFKKNLKLPNIQFQYENIYSAYLQGLISKGDESITKLLIEKVEKGLSNKAFFKQNKQVFNKIIF